MSYVHVPYDSIGSLVQEFQCRDFATDTSGGDFNFVLVDPSSYHGTYGGLVLDSALEKHCRGSFLSSGIGYGMSVVWWLTEPEFCGDPALTYEGKYVAVTPQIFRSMTPRTKLCKPGRSSYYGKADRINSASFSYSDSE